MKLILTALLALMGFFSTANSVSHDSSLLKEPYAQVRSEYLAKYSTTERLQAIRLTQAQVNKATKLVQVGKGTLIQVCSLTDQAQLALMSSNLSYVSSQNWLLGQARNAPGSPVSFIVAASNSTQFAKAGANYLCTGTADQTKLNAAATALDAKGGKLFLMIGKYLISVPWDIDRSAITVEGEGEAFWGGYNGHGWNGTTSVGAATTTGALFEVQSDISAIRITGVNLPDGGDTRHRNNNFYNLAFTSKGTAPASYVGNGITGGQNDDRFHIAHCWFGRLKKSIDLWLDSPHIEDINSQDNAGVAITLKGGGGQISNSLIWDNGEKALSLVAATVNVCNNMFCAPSTAVISLDTDCSNCTFTGNRIERGTGAMVTVTGGSGHAFTGNTFVGQTTNATTGFQASSSSTNLNLTGNTFIASASVSGFAVDLEVGCTAAVTGNTIAGGWNTASSTTIRWGANCTVANNKGSDDYLDPRTVFSPDTLVGYYDASDLRTLFTTNAGSTAVTSTNDKVGLWKDLSGSANDLAGATSPSDWRPNYQAAGINSLPSVHFSGAQILQNVDSGSWAGHGKKLWCMIGFKASSTGSILVAYPFNSAWGSPFGAWIPGYLNISTSFGFRVGATSNDVAGWTATTAASILSWSNETGNAYQNNILVGASGTTADIAYTNNTGLCVGAHNGSGTLGDLLTGDIAFIIITRSEPSREKQLLIYNGRRGKMGVTANGEPEPKAVVAH